MPSYEIYIGIRPCRSSILVEAHITLYYVVSIEVFIGLMKVNFEISPSYVHRLLANLVLCYSADTNQTRVTGISKGFCHVIKKSHKNWEVGGSSPKSDFVF